MKRLFIFATLMVASSINAFATISIQLNGIINNGDGTFTWNYDASLNADSQLSSNRSNPGDPNTTNGFFTIYDVGGFISASAANSNWVADSHNSGLTSPGVTVNDESSIVNVTFRYVGSGLSTVGLGSTALNSPGTFFQIFSNSNYIRQDYVSYRDLNSSGDSADGRSTESVPGEAGAVPEPASMSLLGASIAGLAVYGRRRK